MSLNFVVQSTSYQPPSGLHVGVVMDGNGRWATRRGLPRAAGHRAGARRVREIVEAAPAAGVGTLTLYALSSDNLARPAAEVSALFRLFAEYLRREHDELARTGVRLEVIGRRDRLPSALGHAIETAEQATAGGRRLSLRLAVDYSARAEIRRALVAELAAAERSAAERSAALPSLHEWPDVDLLVRAGGERRLSDFLLWECAYAELWFTDRLWPDFTAADLAAAVDDFRGRDRRFGKISA